MKLRKIFIKNFYSIKEVELDFTKYSGIVQIIGKNKDTGGSNGSGKSSLFEAVVWGLFGKTIRKSTEEALINCDSKKNCEVILEVEREGDGIITIHRGKKPSFLKFFVDGDTLTQDHANNTQALIEKTLETDYKTFVAAILFGQHVDIDFLSSSADDKRNIIRNFLNLDNIFQLRDKIRTIKSDFSTKAKIAEALILDYEKSILEKEDKLKGIDQSDPVIFTETLQEVEARGQRVSKIEKEIFGIQTKTKLLNDTIKKYSNLLESLSDTTTCPTCNSKLSKKSSAECHDTWNAEVNNSNNEIKELTPKLLSLSKELSDLKSKPSMAQYLEFQERNKTRQEAEIYKDQIKDLKDKVTKNSKIKERAEVGYDVMRFWEKAFSEQGLIKYFIKNILDFFNTKTNEYLSQLTNNQFTINFNEELDETICNNGRNIAFISLSGGEKRKINLAVMLALQALLSATAKKQSNIVFFDEVADNLDDDGIMCLYNLLNSLKAENRTIFLITHNNYLKSLLDSTQNLTMMKIRGESKLIESI